jgi:hypothetical protein
MLAVLRDGLPGIEVKSLIAKNQTFPLVLVRRDPSFGNWTGDTRFLDAARVAIHVFCEDPDGDEDAAILSEAVRVVIRDAWLTQKVVPGRGHITRADLSSAPRRVRRLGHRHRARPVRGPSDRCVALRGDLRHRDPQAAHPPLPHPVRRPLRGTERQRHSRHRKR